MEYQKRWGTGLIALVCLTLAACGEPTIDASSDEKMKASIEKARVALPDDEREKFDDAVKTLVFANLDFEKIFSDEAPSAMEMKYDAQRAMDGKSAKEVIAAADKVIQARKEKEKEQAIQEAIELAKKKKRAEADRAELATFEIRRSRFYIREEKYSKQPIMELTVYNGTGHAISQVSFEGTLASSGRSVPWHIDTFSYKIPGGLEPDEEATWQLAPNMFSDWAKSGAPSDAIFTVVAQILVGANGEPLFSVLEFTEQDAKRLEALKREYGFEQQL